MYELSQKKRRWVVEVLIGAGADVTEVLDAEGKTVADVIRETFPGMLDSLQFFWSRVLGSFKIK